MKKKIRRSGSRLRRSFKHEPFFFIVGAGSIEGRAYLWYFTVLYYIYNYNNNNNNFFLGGGGGGGGIIRDPFFKGYHYVTLCLWRNERSSKL